MRTSEKWSLWSFIKTVQQVYSEYNPGFSGRNFWSIEVFKIFQKLKQKSTPRLLSWRCTTPNQPTQPTQIEEIQTKITKKERIHFSDLLLWWHLFWFQLCSAWRNLFQALDHPLPIWFYHSVAHTLAHQLNNPKLKRYLHITFWIFWPYSNQVRHWIWPMTMN